MHWTVIVAVKALPGAKTRLLPASRDADAHRALVQAIRADTIAAASGAAAVGRVLLVADDRAALAASGAAGIVQRSAGLNGALRDGAAYALAHWPGDGAAALVGDLPALRSGELDLALDAAAAHAYAYVPDAEGTGTTLLTARSAGTLQPAFGIGSAARHAVFAAVITAGPGLRTDVDTGDDLDDATALGLGPATAGVLGVTTSRTCSSEPGMMQA